MDLYSFFKLLFSSILSAWWLRYVPELQMTGPLTATIMKNHSTNYLIDPGSENVRIYDFSWSHLMLNFNILGGFELLLWRKETFTGIISCFRIL